MGNIHRPYAIDVHETRDKEGVRLGNHAFGRIIQFIELLCWTGSRIRQGYRTELSQLDVLRAITKGLIHPHSKFAGGHCTDMAIDAITAPGMQFNAQQPDRRPRAQLRGIIGSRQAAKLQQSWFG
ncbi:hypothetical protein D3C76_1375290 [compost metagenome]